MADLDISNVIDSMANDAKKRLSKKTNANKIRNMDDAELAEFISSLVRNADDYLTSEGNWLIWLQSEAE